MIRCWQGIQTRAKCHRCKRAMTWRTTDQGKQIPFRPDIAPVRVDTHPVTFAKFNVFDPQALHSTVCRVSRKADRGTAAARPTESAAPAGEAASTGSLFDGETLAPPHAGACAEQLARVVRVMADQHWRTLAEIAGATGGHDPESSVSARLRDLRKAKFGGHQVDRRRTGAGTYQYRLVPSAKGLSAWS